MVPQRMPPELLAITPPTVAMSVLAGSGPSPYPWRRQHAVGEAQQRAGPHPRAAALVLDPHAGEVAADVDEDAVALALPVEARPARRGSVTGVPVRRA